MDISVYFIYKIMIYLIFIKGHLEARLRQEKMLINFVVKLHLSTRYECGCK